MMSPAAPGSLTPCRVLLDPPGEGAWLMAVDEVLLESVAAGGTAALRFYEWAEPTLSLGYFQAHAERAQHVASAGCPLVRRQTGGGAIMHDRELTYSLAMPIAHPLAADSSRMYREVHQALVEVLAEFSIAARVNEASSSATPFLCFARRSDGDVLVGDAKICGSAQRRRRGAILQHGSLLWARSSRAPELAGLVDLDAPPENLAEIGEKWRLRLISRLQLDPSRQGLSWEELSAAEHLAEEKYRSPTWNLRR